MADIEVVIKISEEKYNKLVMEEDHIRACGSYYPVMILDGVPLPKGHGDLIDRKELLDAFWTYCREGDFGYHQAKDLIKSKLAILEADMQESECEE